MQIFIESSIIDYRCEKASLKKRLACLASEKWVLLFRKIYLQQKDFFLYLWGINLIIEEKMLLVEIAVLNRAGRKDRLFAIQCPSGLKSRL